MKKIWQRGVIKRSSRPSLLVSHAGRESCPNYYTCILMLRLSIYDRSHFDD